jgi:outer membrane protein
LRSSSIIALALALVAASGAAGCAHRQSAIAIVSVTTVERNWPKFVNYDNQLRANQQAIMQSKTSKADKDRAMAQFAQQARRWQDEVSAELKGAVETIAREKNYQMVFTREGVAYGGDDITTDVMKALNITPPSPAAK